MEGNPDSIYLRELLNQAWLHGDGAALLEFEGALEVAHDSGAITEAEYNQFRSQVA